MLLHSNKSIIIYTNYIILTHIHQIVSFCKTPLQPPSSKSANNQLQNVKPNIPIHYHKSIV